MKIKNLDDLKKIRSNGLKNLYPEKLKITVGMASCGLATGAGEVYQVLEEEIKKKKIEATLSKTGCIGFCTQEPLVDIIQKGKPRITFSQVTPKDARAIIEALLNGGVKAEKAFWRMDEDEYLIEQRKRKYFSGRVEKEITQIPLYEKNPFYEKQLKIATRNCGFIDPESIEEYISRGGYFSAYQALTKMKPGAIIDEIKKSRLRGRGGAGFPTGNKWESCRKAEGEIKYVICNADEGDPGAYMDRGILEGDPHSVIEGMIIGAYAIGSHEGYIYIRAEYPLAVKRLQVALKQAQEYGLIGKNIFNSGFDFTITINKGGGAFVCGESTALMASIEGKPGEPRAKYIHTVESGLWERPSNLNNVETWANIPIIISRGADWFSKIGTEHSKGTKVFSVVGKIKNTGLVEVPMGITLREIIYDIGGGIPGGKKFKAVQTGGPSGGCIPEKMLDLSVDFDELSKAGSMMGSGGMIVMDEGTCMVDIAKYFIDFLVDESCGKCVPCREGLKQMSEILNRITEGKGLLQDIKTLEELSEVLQVASLCALGTTAPNPVLTTINYFRNEYLAHIKEKKCPAGVCPDLIKYFIINKNCTGCGACQKVCPSGAITGERKKIHKLNQGKCIKCGACIESCKYEAIYRE